MYIARNHRLGNKIKVHTIYMYMYAIYFRDEIF